MRTLRLEANRASFHGGTRVHAGLVVHLEGQAHTAVSHCIDGTVTISVPGHTIYGYDKFMCN